MRITYAMTFISFLIINITGNICIISSNGVGEQLDFETIDKGPWSNHSNKTDYVIYNQQEWVELWTLTFSNQVPVPDVPTINFTENTVIASYFGMKPSSGYSIEITEIVEFDSQININVGESSPGKYDIVLPALTHPYHIIKTEKITKSVFFNHYIIPRINYEIPFYISLALFFSALAIIGIIFYIIFSKKTQR